MDIELNLQPQGALVLPSSMCARLDLLPGGAACVILQHRQQQRDTVVAALCSVCPSFMSQVMSQFGLPLGT
jgi:hypothetical protein